MISVSGEGGQRRGRPGLGSTPLLHRPLDGRAPLSPGQKGVSGIGFLSRCELTFVPADSAPASEEEVMSWPAETLGDEAEIKGDAVTR